MKDVRIAELEKELKEWKALRKVNITDEAMGKALRNLSKYASDTTSLYDGNPDFPMRYVYTKELLMLNEFLDCGMTIESGESDKVTIILRDRR